MTFSDVVRSTIHVADLADLAAVNDVYGTRFSAAPPPRSTVQVAGIPRGSRVEIEVLAVREARRAAGASRSPRPGRRRVKRGGGKARARRASRRRT